MALSLFVFVHSGALLSTWVIRTLQWVVRTCHGAEGNWDRAPLDLRWLGPESVVSLWIELLTVIAFCAIVCLKWTPKNSRRGEVGYFGSAANSWECGFMRALSSSSARASSGTSKLAEKGLAESCPTCTDCPSFGRCFQVYKVTWVFCSSHARSR